VPTNQPFALTVLSPILSGPAEGGADHAAAIRNILGRRAREERNLENPRPLAAISTLHFARWVVIDDVRSQSWPAREEHLRSKYLLFAADFDGPLPSFLDALFYQAHRLVQSIWEHCVGFPGVGNRAAFGRYFEECRLKRTFPFAAYPERSLPEVLKALDVQRRMLTFIQSTQGKASAELQRAFVKFMEEVERAPVPSGGWV
jgi:hypothetical protein